jgi:uncharacterized protein YbaR (Trm112 family)
MRCKCPNCQGEIFHFGRKQQQKKMNVYVSIDDNSKEITVEEQEDADTSNDEDMEDTQLYCVNCNQTYHISTSTALTALDEDVVSNLIYPKKACARCGNEYPASELDEDDLCIACKMALDHPELGNINSMSEYEMIKLIAKLQADNDALKKPKTNKRGRPKKKAEAEEPKEEVGGVEAEQVDIDGDSEEQDIEISESAPEIPDAIPEMINNE